MTIRGLWLALRGLFARRAVERELDDELRFHLDMEIEQLTRSGMRPDEARREAYRRFGGVERFKEEAREARGTRWLEDATRDLRFGLRSLARAPGFALTALLTLALGVGSTTAVFSVVRGVLLSPCRSPDSDKLVTVWVTNPRQGIDEDITSWPNFSDWRSGTRTLERVAAVQRGRLALTGEGDPEELVAGVVSDGFFELLGAPLALGRGFRADEVEERFQRVTVLSRSCGSGASAPIRRSSGARSSWAASRTRSSASPTRAALSARRGALGPDDLRRSLRGHARGTRQPVAPGHRPRDERRDARRGTDRDERDHGAWNAIYPDANEGMGVALEPLRGDARGRRARAADDAARRGRVRAARGMRQRRQPAARARRRAPARDGVRLSIGAGRARLVRQVLAESALLVCWEAPPERSSRRARCARSWRERPLGCRAPTRSRSTRPRWRSRSASRS
jgi:putative ABC transport system permease protein